MTEEVLEADLTWVGAALQPGVRVAIGPARFAWRRDFCASRWLHV